MSTPLDASRTIDQENGVVCDCPQCYLHSSWDPDTHAFVRGRYVGINERKAHIRAQRGAESAATRIRPPQSSEAPALELPVSADYNRQRPHDNQARELTLSYTLMKRLRDINQSLEKEGLPEVDAAGASLVFCNPPGRHCLPMESPDENALLLQEGFECNSVVLKREQWLTSAKVFVQDIKLIVLQQPSHLDDLQELDRRISLKIKLMARYKMLHWERQRAEASLLSEEVEIIKTNGYMSKDLASIHPVTVTCYVLVAFMHLICGISLKTCRLLVAALQVVVKSSMNWGTRTRLFRIPNDPRTIISHLNLDPTFQTFVCCQKCFEIYPFDPAVPDNTPQVCQFILTPGSDACKEPLRKKTKKGKRGRATVKEEPVRLYLYHELRDWVSRLYCRPDIERLLDDSLIERQAHGEMIWDILDTTELRTFPGPEPQSKQPFLRCKGTEGRLVFSLNMDGFNPFTNKESGKKVTTCAIYMICLNLPPAIRYDVENVFLVSIIPGPHEPSKEQINPLLRPLVDDLLVIWHHGFFLTSTHKYPQGRLIRGALIPLVCDLPAARQMSGFADHSSSNFCSVCKLQAEDIADFDDKPWLIRDNKEHRRLATLWKDAPSDRRQAELYDCYGVRWSELLRLPYWDATRYTIIDSMHAFLLRMLQRHIRQIMGMGVDNEDGDGPTVELLEKDKPNYAVMVEARKTLRTEPAKVLEKLKIDALRELCHAAGLRHSGLKKHLVRQLIDYRIARGWFDTSGRVIGDQSVGLPDPNPNKPPARRLEDDTGQHNSLAPPDQPINEEDSPPGNTKKKRRDVDDPPTEEEVAHGLELLQFGHQRKIATLRKALMKHLCDVKEIDYSTGCKGPELVERIKEWRIKNGFIDANGNPTTPRTQESNLTKKGTKVLGRETLKEIRADMARLTLPSWVTVAPSQPGTKRQGKFTADQWRSFCLINLTFTLTRLWGPEPQGSRKRRMLDNFLHLVTAIKIATMRKMSAQRIKDYTFHMRQYLTTLLDLYPGATISPYQHMALHFDTFLERFGPTHAWRCFPFERYNYLLQNIPTNMKFGDLEITMFRKFCRGQNLRHLFKPSSLPPSLDELVTSWEKLYKADIRGTLRGDAFNFNDFFEEIEESEGWGRHELKILPEDWYLNLRSWLLMHDPDCDSSQLSRSAFLRNSISRLGETYRICSTSSGEGYIYYAEADGSRSAGAIQGIFSHTRVSGSGTSKTQTFFVVDQYRPLPPDKVQLDHYRLYPVVAGKIYQDVCFQGSALISAGEVICHFGRGDVQLPGVELPCFVALPLDRS